MRVLGIDCGLAITGWAIVDRDDTIARRSIKQVDYGVIRTSSKIEIPERLLELYDNTIEIIEEFKPDITAVEDIFYFKNQKTVIKVSQARGVVVLAASKKGQEVFDYTPLQVKQAVCGYGRASKKQIQRMVKTILTLRETPKPDDAADALAVAICHLNSVK